MTRAIALLVVVSTGIAGAVTQASSASSKKSAYTIRVVNSSIGGGGKLFHVGLPINVTVIDHRSDQANTVTICFVPAPISKSSCHHARLNRTLDSIAPSAAGVTKIRVKVGDTVLVRKIRVEKAR